MTMFPVERLKVLLVEDNPHFRTFVRSLLEALGVEEIEEAQDGGEALEILKSYRADLAFLDWKMDGIDGVECVRRIRKGDDTVNRFLPIIMLTGYTEDRLVDEARQAGVSGFLGKPISAKSLFSKILSLMEATQVYIETKDYFGPDRRGGTIAYKGEDRRVAQTNVLTYEPFVGRA